MRRMVSLWPLLLSKLSKRKPLVSVSNFIYLIIFTTFPNVFWFFNLQTHFVRWSFKKRRDLRPNHQTLSGRKVLHQRAAYWKLFRIVSLIYLKLCPMFMFLGIWLEFSPAKFRGLFSAVSYRRILVFWFLYIVPLVGALLKMTPLLP